MSFDPDNWSDDSGRAATADDAINAIQRALRSAGVEEPEGYHRGLSWDNPDHRESLRSNFDSDEEPVLSGFGPDGEAGNARDDCGDPHPFICDDCGNSVEFGRTCKMSVCGRCGSVWCRDAAISKTAKLQRCRKEIDWNSPDEELAKFHHLVFSPPPGWWSTLVRACDLTLPEANDVTWDAVRGLMDALNCPGLAIRHSYRGVRDDGSLKSEGDDRGEWKNRLYSGRGWDDVRDELGWMPHFHVIAVSDWFRADELTKRVEEETGWVLHRIESRDDDGEKSSLEDDGAMAAAATYGLSHGDIMVHDDRGNQSAVRMLGSFDGDGLANSSRFVAQKHDLAWADSTVREKVEQVLGMSPASSDCGRSLPAVDDPDELARRVLEELWPGGDESPISREQTLAHIEQGNIDVEVSSTNGGGGDVTVRDAFGHAVGEGGFSGSSAAALGSDVDVQRDDDERPPLADVLDGDGCGCGDDHADDDRDDCDGSLIPLEEARRRGLLASEEWRADAPHVEEADKTNAEWPEDLEPWKAEMPAAAAAPPPDE